MLMLRNMFMAAVLLVGSRALAADSGLVLRETDLHPGPAVSSPASAHLKPGDSISVSGRQGAWYHAEADGKTGWVSMFAVRLSSVEGVRAQTPPKFLFKTKSAAMGVRGLDEMDLKNAKPDEKALDELEQYAASPEELAGFGRFHSEALHPVDSGSLQKIDAGTLADEARFGHQIAATLLGGAPLVRSAALQRYVNLVGAWVAQRSDRPDLHWRFGVLASDSINAFAVPGGYVFVTFGLYQRLSSESELAGVLGHEISHVVARDHYNLLVAGRAMKAAQDALKKLKMNSSTLTAATASATDLMSQAFTTALDQNAETRADEMGMLLASDAGYEPFGLARVLQLLSVARPDDPNLSVLLKTHPAPLDRLRAIEPMTTGYVSSRSAAPDLRDRFKAYDLRGLKLRRAD